MNDVPDVRVASYSSTFARYMQWWTCHLSFCAYLLHVALCASNISTKFDDYASIHSSITAHLMSEIWKASGPVDLKMVLQVSFDSCQKLNAKFELSVNLYSR